jgi:putative transposase
VDVWADSIYVKAGPESTKVALLVLIAALADGTKLILAVESGHRDSADSWAEILRDLTRRGFRAPACVIGDGALGLWNAVGQVWPQAQEQRCWNHKLRNVVDAVPLQHQPDVQAAVQKIVAADSVTDAGRERQCFHRQYRLRFPKACERLDRDWARMLTYYQFPKEHWRHLRTTNVVESPFAAVRLRTSAAKRFKKVERRPRSSGACCKSRRSASANSTRPRSVVTSSAACATPTASKCPLFHPPRRPPPDAHLHTS